MQDTVQPVFQDLKIERCPRCLQPVSPKLSRCPGCRQSIHSLRWLPLAIGAMGLLALVFAMLLMYRVVRNEDLTNAPVPVDEGAPQQQGLLPNPPPHNRPTNQPAKAEKRPPLNER